MIYVLLFASFSATFLCCWAFLRYTGSFFVAKPRDWTPERHHQTKQGIPTMGGLALIGVLIVGTIGVCYRFKLWQLGLLSVGTLLSMGLLGAYDDWSKIKRRGGISARTKFIAQNLSALAVALIWYMTDPISTGYLWVPFLDCSIYLGAFIVLWATLVTVSASNAINLTDGLDGLAGTVLGVSFASIALCARILGYPAIMMSALFVVGACSAFLCLNWHPARLFMGDTGALALGALLGLFAVQLNITLLLPLIAVVPVIETVSVIVQVAWYKRYQKRLFKMAPLHHHFELEGCSEYQIVCGAALFTLICSGGAVALVYFKY